MLLIIESFSANKVNFDSIEENHINNKKTKGEVENE